MSVYPRSSCWLRPMKTDFWPRPPPCWAWPAAAALPAPSGGPAAGGTLKERHQHANINLPLEAAYGQFAVSNQILKKKN